MMGTNAVKAQVAAGVCDNSKRVDEKLTIPLDSTEIDATLMMPGGVCMQFATIIQNNY